MSDKKSYDRQVEKGGKLASFMSPVPYSEAEKKKRGTETVDFMARRDAAKVNAKAAAAKKTPARKK